jgi:membrane protease YdiL (CAAX protease family)
LTQTLEKSEKENAEMDKSASEVGEKKAGFKLYEHPWLAMLAVILTTIIVIIPVVLLVVRGLGLSYDSPLGGFALTLSDHIMVIFLLTPFVLRLPRGKSAYGEYLKDIGLKNWSPFFQLLLLGLSCYLILALSQAAASVVYRISEGSPVSWSFIRNVFNISGELPPSSPSLLFSTLSIFEEVVSRGILITTFLNKYKKNQAIIFSSLGFALMHILNLINGQEPIWVLGQVAWAFCIGLFYGYVFVNTQSLLPPMIVHYLGNAFIGSLTGYLQARASIEIQALYGVIFSLGIIPTTLMILWARFYISRWLPVGKQRQPALAQAAAA